MGHAPFAPESPTPATVLRENRRLDAVSALKVVELPDHGDVLNAGVGVAVLGCQRD
ncbi:MULTISPECIES: hypothetical protein [Mycobacterium]|uniref:hypothetical protein n=1 Tax=Mycobacterium TaxID=1763 RepID=UPI000AE56CC2|nr:MULTISPECIES: hypothetical protein [Mycobacterium]